MTAVFEPYLNAKAVGVKGDGTTDDLAALQAAINTVSAAGGGIVLLPAGDYLLSGTLFHKSHVTLQGAGAGSRLMINDANAPTVSVGSASSPDTEVDNWAIKNIHFNPAVGITRTLTAPEIDVRYARAGTIDSCGFGRRVAMTSGASASSTAEESRVGTCVNLDRRNSASSGAAALSAVIKLTNTWGFGYYRNLRIKDTVDIWIDRWGGDANSSSHQSVYLTGRVEALLMTNCDFVSSVSPLGNTNVCMLIDNDGVRLNQFTNCDFDTSYHGVDAQAGFSNIFNACWFSCRPGVGAKLSGTATGYIFNGCQFENNGSEGILISNGKGHKVTASHFASNSQSTSQPDIHVGASCTGAVILGNDTEHTAYGLSAGTGSAPYGCQIEPGATNVQVANNNFSGSGGLNNLASGTASVHIGDNL